MKLSQLLLQREALLRQARLSNLAYAYSQLGQLVKRLGEAQLRGLVRLQQADSAVDRAWPTLTAMSGNQSVIEEHFTDENVLDLASFIAFITGETGMEITFQLEDMGEQFIAPLERELERAGVVIDPHQPRSPGSNQRGPNRVQR
jgi:hypothetical protein